MNAILSYPYSGAIYWWAAVHGEYGGDQSSTRPAHLYYRTLYGKPESNVDVALALSIVFDDLFLPAVDAVTPGVTRGVPNHLAFHVDWSLAHEASAICERHQSELLNDESLALFLEQVPTAGRAQVLHDAIQDILLSLEHDAPVISSTGRRDIILRLVDLDVIPGSATTASRVADSAGTAEAVRHYGAITGMMFASDRPDLLGRLKGDSTIRAYAAEFTKALQSSSPNKLEHLIDSMRNAWDAAGRMKVASEIFTTTTRVLGPIGLIPGVGTLAGAVSMASDAAGLATARESRNLRWYELGPEVQRVKSLNRLGATLDRIIPPSR